MSTRDYNIRLRIDGKEIPNSVNDLSKSQRTLRKELRGLEQGTDQYIRKSQQLNRVSKRLKEVRADVGKVGNEWKKQQSMWQQAKSVFAGTFAALSVQGAIASVQQLSLQMVRFVKDLTKRRREITRLTDVTGRDLDIVSSKIQSIVDTYDQDFNEVLVAGNALSKQMGISQTEALELMQQGFANGADASKEFLSNLKEYPAQFKSAGLSAEQAISIITMQAKTGIFSDKGADTIKEGTLRLREMTKATKEALQGIGISSDELEKKLKNNTITYFEAIQMVAHKLDELPPQSVKVGTALADIFGGAGEDAGLDFITMLGDVNLEMQKLETPTTKLAEANERLALAYQALADDDGILTRLEIGFKNFSAWYLNTWQSIYGPIFSLFADADELVKQNPADGNVGPQPVPGINLNRKTTPGSVSVDAKTALASSMGSSADSVDQFLVDFADFTEQITREDLFDGLEDATDDFESKFNDATNDMMQSDIDRTTKAIQNSEARQAAEAAELEMKHQLIEATILQGMQSVQNAETIEEYGQSALGLIRRQIQAKIAEGIANAIAAQLGTGPIGVITAGLAGIAAQGIFNQIVPSFSRGGYTGSGNMGLGKNSGGYIRGVVEEDEYVINRQQLQDPYVANFARMLESSKIGTSALNVSTSLDASQFGQHTDNFGKLVAVLLKNGIEAKISDSTLDDIDDRKSKLNRTRKRSSL